MERKSLYANCKKYMLWVALLGVAQSLFAGVPEGYYSRIDGEKKTDLKAAVKACINDGKKTFSYKALWTIYPYTDFVIGDEKKVFDYYSLETFYFTYKDGTPTGSVVSGMNKEHACPQSWWGKGSKSNCYSDLFNVMPSETSANSSKSNYPVGIVDTDQKHFDNGRIKTGKSATGNFSGSVFEPADEHKGDFARIYFYVATMYDQTNWQTNNTAFKKEAYPTIKSNFIQLLLQWHRQDPVSEWEIVRNERVYGQQNNRNPYIDYPQLAEYIWGDSTEYAFDLEHAKVNGYGGYVGPDPNPDPDPNPNPDPDPDPNPDPDPDPIPDPIPGDTLFIEDFDDVTEGSISSNNTPWSGNDNFASVKTIYQAGEVVRLGSSSKAGSLTTYELEVSSGQDIVVGFDVKGWTTIEGKLLVSLGDKTETVSYSATRDKDFEPIQLVFQKVKARPVLKFETSTKRCFLDNIVVYVSDTSGIESLEAESVDAVVVDLQGRPCPSSRRGLQVRSGKIVLQK